MDTMGALALGTEAPTPELLDRAPYRRDCSLISPAVWRNILVQSAFQLVLLGYLLLHGAQDLAMEVGSRAHLTFIFNTFVLCQGMSDVLNYLSVPWAYIYLL